MKKISRHILLFIGLSVFFALLSVACAFVIYNFFLQMQLYQKILGFITLVLCIIGSTTFMIKCSSALYIKSIITAIEDGSASTSKIAKHIKSNPKAVNEYINKSIKRGYLKNYKLNDDVVYLDMNKKNITCSHCGAKLKVQNKKCICPYCGCNPSDIIEDSDNEKIKEDINDNKKDR